MERTAAPPAATAQTLNNLYIALSRLVGAGSVEQLIKGLGFQNAMRFVCNLDPVFFMRNFVKVRSQPDITIGAFDEEEEVEDSNAPSVVTLLDLWPKQEELVRALQEYHWVVGPKSRKIGFTTTGIGFGNWVQTFMPNTRCHYISRRDDAAKNMIERHIFSYKRLPDYLKLPIREDNDHVFTVEGPDGDLRTVQAYPATEDTAIEETADYTLLDEFASIREPLAGKLWSGIEPTISPNGYVLIISRGKGPQGTFAKLVREAASGF